MSVAIKLNQDNQDENKNVCHQIPPLFQLDFPTMKDVTPTEL